MWPPRSDPGDAAAQGDATVPVVDDDGDDDGYGDADGGDAGDVDDDADDGQDDEDDVDEDGDDAPPLSGDFLASSSSFHDPHQ